MMIHHQDEHARNRNEPAAVADEYAYAGRAPENPTLVVAPVIFDGNKASHAAASAAAPTAAHEIGFLPQM